MPDLLSRESRTAIGKMEARCGSLECDTQFPMFSFWQHVDTSTVRLARILGLPLAVSFESGHLFLRLHGEGSEDSSGFNVSTLHS